MALIDEVQYLCERLEPAGWYDLLLLHGLDIKARPLNIELAKVLTVDRTIKGFEDFSLQGERAIEPGTPAGSLLYHALASPNVTLGAGGEPLTDFPTAAELEMLLNYVYGATPPSLAQLQARADSTLALVVFAVEYRPRPETVHRKHADLCFSRTGIARVGTAPMLYEPYLRGFRPFVEGQPHAMRVTPTRYSAYLAVQQKGQIGPGWVAGDEELDFWIPLHKVFNGCECIAGLDLQLDLEAYHVNDKLRQFHIRQKCIDWSEPDISQAPFVVTENLAQWADNQQFGAGLCVPVPHERLVEPAQYQGQPVFFSVPPNYNFDYIINKRHQLRDDGSIRDLNNEPNVEQIIKDGNYRALHFIDFTAEGWIKAHCPVLSQQVPLSVAAYSILSAPDFYPACGQAELVEWEQQQGFPESIWYVSLKALSERRLAANPQMAGGHFVLEDKGVPALVSQLSTDQGNATTGPVARAERQSWLPDTAAGTFSPGWEIAGDGQGFVPKFMCAYNLGSPFTEDVRICSAAGGYWPAVTPDSARTFEPEVKGSKSTVIPLTDAEIGQTGGISWDGEVGPRLIFVDGRQVVEYTAYEYSDYTNNALAGQLSLQGTGKTSSEAYQQRILAMQLAYFIVGARDRADKGQWAVLSFQQVVRPDAALEQAESEGGEKLPGDKFFFFSLYRYGAISTPADFTRRHVEVVQKVDMFIGDSNLLINTDGAGWQVRARD